MLYFNRAFQAGKPPGPGAEGEMYRKLLVANDGSAGRG